jgi:hypothetical protein
MAPVFFAAILLVAQIACADTLPKYDLEGRWFQIDISVKGIAGPPAFQELPLVKTQFKTVYYLYFDFDSIGGEHYDLIMVYQDSPGDWTSQTIPDYIKPVYQYGEVGEAYQLPIDDSGFYAPDGSDVDLTFTGMIVLKPDQKVFGVTKGATVYMSAVTNDGSTPEGSLRSGTVKIKGKQVVESGGDTSKLPFNPLNFIP